MPVLHDGSAEDKRVWLPVATRRLVLALASPREETPVAAPVSPREETPVTAPVSQAEETPVAAPASPAEETPVAAPASLPEETPVAAPPAVHGAENIPESPVESDGPRGRLVEPARLLKRIIPVYPPLAKNARVQGDVVLEATIGENGEIEDVNVVSGHPLLRPAALDAVRQWRYEPARIGGVPTRSSASITVHFNLRFTQ